MAELQLKAELQAILDNKPYKITKEFLQTEALQFDNALFSLSHDKPVLGRSKAVIVSGIAFSANRHVVMIQEAKQSARGQWYLPAGRLEINESLEAAVRREFLEESGLTFEPKRVVSIECRDCSWLRVNFLGEIVGGKLKDYEDKESMCAKWIPVSDVVGKKINLRSSDIIPLLLLANFLDNRRPKFHRRARLPLPVSWPCCHLRLLIQRLDPISQANEILCRVLPNSTGARLPIVRMQHPSSSLHTLAALIGNMVVGQPLQFNSVLHCEFQSTNGANCGLFLTILCQLLPTNAPSAPQSPQLLDKFNWLPSPQSVASLTVADQFSSDSTDGLTAKVNDHSIHLCMLGNCKHSVFTLT